MKNDYPVFCHSEWVSNLKKIHVNTGIQVAYMEMGEDGNPPLIIVHGFSDNSRSTRAMCRTYANYFHVFALDQRGHGQSDKPRQFAYTSAQLGLDILAFADALRIDSFYLIGTSMGSMASQYAAFSAPERILGLGLISTMCRFLQNPEDLEDQRKAFIEYASNPPALAEECPTYQQFADQEFAPAFYSEMKEWPTYCRLAAWYGMFLSDHRRFLQYIQAPTVVVWGEKDDLVTESWRQEFQNALPSASYHVLKNITHEVQQEAPDETAGIITEFFLSKAI